MGFTCPKCGRKSNQRDGIQAECAKMYCVNCGHEYDSALLNTRKRLRKNSPDDEPIISVELKIFLLVILLIWIYNLTVGPLIPVVINPEVKLDSEVNKLEEE